MEDKIRLSQKIRRLITPLIKEIVKAETRSCMRVQKAFVVTTPNGSVCSVRLAGDTTIITIPYSSATANVAVGAAVWVAVLGDSLRNAIVWQKVDFS